MTCENASQGSSAPPTKRNVDGGGESPCLNIPLYDWPCQQMENDLLGAKGCAVDVGQPGGAGTINF